MIRAGAHSCIPPHEAGQVFPSGQGALRALVGRHFILCADAEHAVGRLDDGSVVVTGRDPGREGWHRCFGMIADYGFESLGILCIAKASAGTFERKPVPPLS